MNSKDLYLEYPEPRQKGMTTIGWLFVIFLFGFFLMLVFKIVPAYMDSYKIKDSLVSITEMDKEEFKLKSRTKKGLIRLIQRRFEFNNVEDLIDPKLIKSHKTKKTLRIDIDYEIRVPLFANISLMMAFHPEVEMTIN